MSSPAAPNLPPQPIDDPHMRVANHEDLLPSDYDEIVDRMLDSPDDFAAWEAELRALDATPAPTPEDERNKEKLAIVFDRPAFTETVEAAETLPPEGERERLEETAGILKGLGRLVDTKPQNTDTVNESDPLYREIKASMAGMGMVDEDLIKANYLSAHGTGGQAMQRWEAQKAKLMDEAKALLEEHPEQSAFFIAQGAAYRNNAESYHNAPAGKTSTWDKASDKVVGHQTQHRRIASDANIPDASLEAATVRVDLRDATTDYRTMRADYEKSVRLSENFQELLDELPIDYEDGAQRVADFLTTFEAANDRNIDEALKDLKEGENFRVYLEAGSDPDERAKAEQPIWRDVEYTGRAAKQLKVMLDDMKSKGMSRAHSHYREVYAKFAEVQRAHVATWQRWQTVRQAHAVERNPLGAPDFQGRRAVIVAGDQQKGIYVMEGSGKPFTVVYPDSSLRSIAFDPAGKPVPGDRINLDGSEWTAPDPITLTYEEAAPAATTTAGIMGRVAMVRNVAGRTHERTDDRDIPTLVTAYKDALFQAHMDPSNPQVVAQAYDITRLLEQRTAEQIDVIEAVDPADRTPEQDANLATLRHSRGALQARAKYLEHGSEGNLSTMNPDASINFRGTMYDQERPRNWRVALTGDAVMQFAGGAQQVYRADGTRV